jgi:hypothetical protein
MMMEFNISGVFATIRFHYDMNRIPSGLPFDEEKFRQSCDFLEPEGPNVPLESLSKSMKASRMKNMMNKEFQHFVESQLLEVKNMKMEIIQFVSVLDLFQIKLMKSSKMKMMMNKES